MYPNPDPSYALQVAYRRNAEDRARAERWRLTREARRAARHTRPAEPTPNATGSLRPRWVLHWLLGAVRLPRSAG